MIFWGLKFDIFSIPNFLATFYVLGSPVQNDLNLNSYLNSISTSISYELEENPVWKLQNSLF